jgi:hypothetical protein
MAQSIVYLVRVTTDDREHQLWVTCASSEQEALESVLEAVQEEWTAAPLSNKLKPMKIEAFKLRHGEVREISSIAGSSATLPGLLH